MSLARLLENLTRLFRDAALAVLAACLVFLVPGRVFGAVFQPSPSRQLLTALLLARPRRGESFVDLGAGDGRVVALAARLGLSAVGYEINPLLVLAAWARLAASGLWGPGRIKAGDLWRADLSAADVVFIYGMPHLMRRFEAKLRAELKPGARVVSVDYRLPGWQPVRSIRDVYLYRVPERPGSKVL